MAYRSSTTGTGAGPADPSTAVPAGAAAGDVVVLAVCTDGTDVTSTPPAGFTSLASTEVTNDGQTMYLWWKRLTASDAGSYTVTSDTTLDWVCQAVCFSGRHATDNPAVSTTAQSNSSNASPITVTANGVTAVAGDDLLWFSGIDRSGSGGTVNHTAPTNFTERQDTTNAWAAASVATRENVSAGATGSIAGSASGGSGGWAAWVVRIPAGGAAPNQGAATGAITWTGTATGSAPTATMDGVATGSISWIGSATGARASRGAATGAVSWVGVASSISFPYVADVSANGRYFVDHEGNPILVKGDSPWAILQNSSTTSMENYLDTRASQGFNVVLCSLLGNVTNGGPNDNGNTFDGVSPFVGGDPAVLNDTYWDRVDHFISYAASVGISVMAYPIDGWVADSAHSGLASAWSTTVATDYGEAVGTRLASHPNVFWAVGGDYESVPNTDATMDARQWAVMTGIANVGADRIKTVQFEPNQISTEETAFWDEKVQFNFVYSYARTYIMVERGYDAPDGFGNDVPALMSETQYEETTVPGTYDAFYFRQQALWALTCGSPGEFYGSWSVWDQDPTNLSTAIVAQFTAFRSAIEQLDGWHQLVPDFASAFITAGRGTKAGGGSGDYTGGGGSDTYTTGAITTDGTLAVIYHPAATSRTITINQALLVADYTARWVDPTDGTSVPTSTGSTYTKVGANADGDGDWLLVLEANHPEGSASGTISWVGTATGDAPTIPPTSGAASGTITWAGSATGSRPAGGTAAGTVARAGSATGTAPTIGVQDGAATGTVLWAGTATGSRTSSGSASGSVARVGSATGEAPTLGLQDGSASGSVVWTGAATGARASKGATVGTLARSGVATGARISTGSVSATLTWAGTAEGRNIAGRDVAILALTDPATTLETSSPEKRGSVYADPELTLTASPPTT